MSGRGIPGWGWRLLQIALAAAVMVWIAAGVDLSRFTAALAGASAPLAAAAVGLFVADDLLVTHKWRRLLQGSGIDVPFGALFRVYLEGRFIAFFIPSSVASDLYKGAVVSRDHGGARHVASSIVLERLLGLLSIVTISLAAASLIPARWEGASASGSALLAATAVSAGLAIFLHADRIASLLLPRLPARWAGVRHGLDALASAFSAYRGKTALLVEAFLLSLAIQAARGAGVWVLARSVGDGTPLRLFLLLVPYVYLVNLLPVASSRIGLEQGVFVWLFGAVGMRAETALAVSLLSVAGSLVAALPGGVWLLARRPRGRAEAGGGG